MGVQAWHQIQANVWESMVNGTSPLVRAVDDFVYDLKEIVSEPVPSLVVVESHYWNQTIEGINKHGNISMDKQIWVHFNELVAKRNNFKHEKRISNHLGELREAFDKFITKFGQDLELLVQICKLEVKDMWLA